MSKRIKTYRPSWLPPKEEVKKITSKRYDQDQRDQASKALYNSKAWKLLRALVLAEEPVCPICGTRPATEVHHKKPVREYPELALERENVVGRCKPCHNKERANQ